MFSSNRFTKILATGAVAAAVACSTTLAASSSVKATADVNVRSEASTSSAVKCVLPKGATATKLGTSGNWVKVKYKDVTGYVYNSYVEDVKSSSSSSSSSSESTKTVYITASSLNVRSGPGTSYDVVGSLKKGASVKTYGTKNGWYKIKYDGKTAYINSDYTSTKAPSGSSSSSSSSASSSTETKKVYITASSLNVRSGPGTDYKVVGSLKEGAAVNTYGTKDGWYKIKYNDKTAYISKKYTSTKAPSGSSGSSDTSSDSSGSSTSVSYNVKITASALNVRSGPSTDYSIKGTLYEGDVVKATGLSDGWYKIKFNGDTGYISSKYATKTSDSVSSGSGSSSSGSSGDSSSSDSSSSSSSLSSSERSEIVSLAKSKLGCSYVYGAEGPNTFDCSGFTQWLYKQFGISIPRNSSAQWSGCNKISKSSLKPGDLVFFSNSSSGDSVGHVAMYIGNDTIIHAANSDSGVITSSLSSNYYSQHYIGSGCY